MGPNTSPCEREGATLVLTLNRPEAKNALSLPMLVGLYDGWLEADEDDDDPLRSCSPAPAAPSAPGWTSRRWRATGMEGEQYRDRLKADPDLHWKAMLRHHRPRKPVIAAVEGHCVAGGTEILQGTDIRVAGAAPPSGSSRSGAGCSRSAARRSGCSARSRAPTPWRCCSPAARTPPRRPRGIGLIGHVVPDGTALEKALEIAEQINACGPLAVEAVKASVYETAEMTETDGLAAELERGWPVFDTADAKEGSRAFAEKRPPVYRRA